MDLSVVICVFNESGNIGPLIEETVTAVSRLGRSYEIVVVDDGSRDNTRAELRALRDRFAELRVVLFRRNFGQTAALAAGIAHARGDVVVTMDGDGENDPADIPRLLERLVAGVDMVCGWRVERWKGSFLSRRLPSEAANRIIGWTTGVQLHDYGCTLKAFRSWLAGELELYGEMHRFVPAIASDRGARVVEAPVAYRTRRFGSSKYGLSRTLRVILDLITVKFLASFKTRPIQVFGLWGLVSVIFGILWVAELVIERQFLDIPMGNRPQFFLAFLFILAGMQFITLGLLGEMLARTYHESQGKPIYVVEEILE